MKRKLMLVLTCAVLAIASLAFVACDNNNALNDPRANANVLVMDAFGQPVSGAKVTLATAKGKSVTTDANGIATIKDLTAGEHAITISADGYAAVYDFIQVVMANALGDTPVVETKTTNSTLPRIGATVTGKVEILKNGKQVPAANAKLSLIADRGSLVNTLFETTSDASGNYTFADLPESTNFNLIGNAMTDNNANYTSNSVSVYTNRIENGAIKASVLNFTPVAGQFEIKSERYLVKTSKNTPIVVDFSQPVDLSQLINNHITTSTLVDKVWSDGNKRLTVTPVSGDWNNDHVTLSLSTNIMSTQGIRLGSNITIYLDKAVDTTLGNVGTISLTAGSNMHDMNDVSRNVLGLTWTAVTGATDYLVYYRTDKTNSYSSVHRNCVIDGTTVTLDLTYDIYQSNFNAEGKFVEFIVYATNADGGRSQKGTTHTINTIPVNP